MNSRQYSRIQRLVARMLLASDWEGDLELKRNSSESGYYGVIKSNKKWQARLYKPSKRKWDHIGTFDTPRQAAEVAAREKKKLKDGLQCVFPAV